MIPHVAPPVWPEIRASRFAQTIVRNAPELLDDPSHARGLLAKCSVALIGLPDDSGIELNAGRVGAAQGPAAVRAMLARYGVASPADTAPGSSPFPRVFDAGDIILGADIHQTHERISQASEALTRLNLLPLAIGGGHDLTFALVRGVARVLGPLDGVYLDAHLDVRPEVGSGMPFRALLDGGFASSLTAIGLNPLVNSEEHLAYLSSRRGRSLSVLTAQHDLRLFEDNAPPLFVSLDLDAIDASAAPGVSAPNPCGMTSNQAEALIRRAGRSPRVRCFDIMELSPPHDQDHRTARLAAHLLLTFLRGVSERSSPRPDPSA